MGPTRLRLSGGVAALGLLGLLSSCTLSPGTGDTAPEPGGPSAWATTRDWEQADPPAEPPARICGSASLRGPARPPDEARSVSPEDDLAALVREAPEGSVFWLAPGVHRIGAGGFAQVRPRDGQRFVGAPGAVIDGGGVNRYAFGGRGRDVTIEHLTIRGFGRPGGNHNEGVVNHDAAPGWTVRDSTITRNAGAGLFLGSGAVARGNCLSENGQYGFSAYHRDGVRDVVLEGNEVVGNNTDDWESRIEGCGCTGGGKFWATTRAAVVGNWVHDNTGVGIWADNNNTGFLVAGNLVEDNTSSGLLYETSYNARVVANTFRRNAVEDGDRNPGFPTPAVYLSESGGDDRADGPYQGELLVSRNRFVDNWSGVIAWENADRFAGSPANTSTGETTLVNPAVATVEACSDPALIGEQPYVDDCRWKTQHVRVLANDFELDPDRVAGCSPDRGCGFVGVFSNWGSFPPWSPFHGQVVEDAITFDQDNLWDENRYVGPWQFMAHEQNEVVDWDTWRTQYGQDPSSTLEQ